MKMGRHAFMIAVGIAVLVSGFGQAVAETSFYDYKVLGEVELGFRAFLNSPSDESLGKIEEYQDLSNPFLGNMHLLMLNKDESYLVEFQASKIAGEDQSYFLRSSRPGLFEFRLGWDQVPHIYSTLSPLKDEISVRWDSANFAFFFTPTPEWDLGAEYTLTMKEGDIPKGLALSFPPALNFKEILLPVEMRQHDVTLSSGLAKQNYQLQFSYNLALFDNADSYKAVPQGGGLFDPHASLPPDSVAHTFTLAGGLNLPYKTRINSSLSYSLRLQSEDFISGPFTPPAQGDLDGLVNIVNFYLSGVSRPVDPLTLKAMYRLYYFGDDSDEIDIRDVLFVQSLRAERYPYTKHTAGLNGQWKFRYPVSLNVGFNWQRWERDADVREVAATDEYIPSISVDYTPLSWLLFRVGYSHSTRVGSDYQNLGVAQRDVQQRLLRKFSMADRDRDKVEFFAELTPFSTLTFSTNFGLALDDYSESTFGLLDDQYWAAGADITWRPIKRLALSVGYLHEDYHTRQQSGLEVDVDPGPALTTDDSVDTVTAGASISLIPSKLDLDLRSSLSYATSDFNNPNLPDLKNALISNKASLRYRFTEHWAAKLGYMIEIFETSDAYTETIAPDPTIFVDDFYEDGTAHIITCSVSYRF